jgi:hypothetical protein
MIKNEPSDSGSKKVPDQKNPPARKKRRRPASRHKNRSGGEVTPDRIDIAPSGKNHPTTPGVGPAAKQYRPPARLSTLIEMKP